MKLKVLKKIGRYVPGDVLELKDSDATMLILLRVAEAIEEGAGVPVPARRSYRRRDLHAEE